MANILLLIAQLNFRDEELKIPKEVFEKEGFKVTIASITTDESLGMLGLRVRPAIAVREANPNDFDALVVVGGSGSPKLADYPEVLDIIRRFERQDKPIAAICLGGYVLAKAGILSNRNATVYPADFALAEYRKQGVVYSSDHVVVDGKIVTADGPEVAKEFAEQIVKLLK